MKQKSVRKNNIGKKRPSSDRGVEGYLTVEAALIMPVVFYVCIFIIYSGFFVYDRCVMKQDAYRAVLKAGSIYRQDSQEVYNTAWDMLSDLTNQKYVAANCQYEVTVQDKVRVTITGRIQVPFNGLEEMTNVSVWDVEETAESKCLNPVFLIRMCRQVMAATREE